MMSFDDFWFFPVDPVFSYPVAENFMLFVAVNLVELYACYCIFAVDRLYKFRFYYIFKL